MGTVACMSPTVFDGILHNTPVSPVPPPRVVGTVQLTNDGRMKVLPILDLPAPLLADGSDPRKLASVKGDAGWRFDGLFFLPERHSMALEAGRRRREDGATWPPSDSASGPAWGPLDWETP